MRTPKTLQNEYISCEQNDALPLKECWQVWWEEQAHRKVRCLWYKGAAPFRCM